MLGCRSVTLASGNARQCFFAQTIDVADAIQAHATTSICIAAWGWWSLWA
jgi:hypothetical protein